MTREMTAAREFTAPATAARIMGIYAKDHSAGAFAMPTRKDIETLQASGDWIEAPGVFAATKHLSRDSVRKDFTGRAYVLPGHSRIVTHLAAEPDAALPDLSFARAVYAYIEDANVTRQLHAQGREVYAVRVSASSELIGCWMGGYNRYAYPEEEAATIRRIPMRVDEPWRRAILAEVGALDGWLDDFPFYSDGSWSALNLRGFKPDDPSWGIKPSEMSKSWWAEHPEALALNHCDWTTLAERTPAIVDLVRSVGWWGGLERVRLLRMQGRNAKRTAGRLSRHTDVTDRAAGTRDGKISRFHIPLVTDPSITMTAWNLAGRSQAVHLPAWSMWYLDARKPHAVANPSTVERVHLVVDVVSDSEVRTAISGGAEHVA